MSSLLIPCEPLQVLPNLAKAIGLNEAIFLQQLHYWLLRSKNEHEGKLWVHNTFEKWREQFPFWSTRTLQRIVAELVKQEIVLVRKFGSSKWDHRNWYSINYDSDKLAGSSPTNGRVPDTAKVSRSYKDQEITSETTIKSTPKRGYKPPEPEIKIDPPFHGREFLAALSQYETVKREIKSPLTPTSREALFCKLAKFDEETATIALAEAAASGYKGVFPEKVNGNGKSKNEPDRPVWMACKKRMLPDGTWVDDK